MKLELLEDKMKGTYKFYQGEDLLSVSENLITEAGRKQIMRYLAGLSSSLAGSISVGIGSTTPTTSDERLNFEFDRAIISLSSVDFINNRLVFKGTLNQGIIGTIYETGLYSQPFATDGRGYDSKLLFAFGNAAVEQWVGGTYANTNNRVSPNALRVTAAASGTATATLDNIIMDLSGYSNLDTFKIAFKPTNSFVTNFKIRFVGSDPASYYETTITPSGTGYQFINFNKTNFTKTGTNVDYSSIQSVALIVAAGSGGSGSIDFDAMRVEDVDSLDQTNILVSRAVLSTPIVKDDVVPLEVEYALDVSIA